ncbi:MAG: hypothetical protein ACLRSE_08305 [Alistipes finegoldii]
MPRPCRRNGCGCGSAEETARAKRARIKPAAEAVVTETEEEAAASDVQVDFADEEAALAAQDAGLELEGETAEEAEAEQMAGSAADTEDKFTGRGKEELVALFTRMLEEQPVQSIRRDVEALKIAFYRIRRAEVEAARRKFIEEGGAEEDFAPAVDGVEVQLKELVQGVPPSPRRVHRQSRSREGEEPAGQVWNYRRTEGAWSIRTRRSTIPLPNSASCSSAGRRPASCPCRTSRICGRPITCTSRISTASSRSTRSCAIWT